MGLLNVCCIFEVLCDVFVLDCISADNGDGSRTLAAIALQNAPFCLSMHLCWCSSFIKLYCEMDPVLLRLLGICSVLFNEDLWHMVFCLWFCFCVFKSRLVSWPATQCCLLEVVTAQLKGQCFVIWVEVGKKGEGDSLAHPCLKFLWCQTTAWEMKRHWLKEAFSLLLKKCFSRILCFVVRREYYSVGSSAIWGFLSAHSMVGCWIMC